jgi:CHAT domain-containing protein
LWDVPFAALLGGKKEVGSREAGSSRSSNFQLPTSSFLLNRFALSYAYSATGAMAALQGRSAAPLRPKKTLLALANPAFGSARRFGDSPAIPGQRPLDTPSRPLDNPSRPLDTPSRPLETPSRPLEAPSRLLSGLIRNGKIVELPGTQREADALRKYFPGARILTRQRAQERIFKQEAGQYRYLHLATHGFTNDAAPLMSSLVLAEPGRESAEDGFLTARELLELDLNAELAVLSACNTGRGERKAGEGVVGLSWALLVAGCPSVVVSQWGVDDASTATLMIDFYRNLTQGRQKADALRQAALRLERRQRTRHPYYWASFVLIGSGK